MAINIGKLWREGKFSSSYIESKLLYIYLATSPNINTLGLLNIRPSDAQHDLGMLEGPFRKACLQLRDKKYIQLFTHDSELYFVVLDHFNTLPKSITVSKRVEKDKKALPEGVLSYMKKNNLLPDVEKHFEFKPPTTQEVEEYALSKGHMVNAEEFIEFYEEEGKKRGKKGWYDSRGKAVRDWRAKLRKVWFREENKLARQKDAPKGFEYFFAKLGDRIITPDYWSGGMPRSKGSLIEDKTLKNEFKKQKENKANS